MNEATETALACRPALTALRVHVTEPTVAVFRLDGLRAKDADLMINGERARGVRGVEIAVRDDGAGDDGTIWVRRTEGMEWAATEDPVALAILVHDPNTGEDVGTFHPRPVRLGEPVWDADGKHGIVPLMAGGPRPERAVACDFHGIEHREPPRG